MINRNRKSVKIFNVISDTLIIVLSYVISMFARYSVLNGSVTVDPFEARFIVVVFVIALGMSVAFQAFNKNYLNVIPVNLVGTLLIMAFFFVNRDTEFSRWSLVLFFAISSLLVIGKHALGHKLISKNTSLGYGEKTIALAGNGKTAQQYIKDMEINFPNYKIIPFNFDTNSNVDEIVIALDPEETTKAIDVIKYADKEGIYVSLIPFYSDFIPTHPEIETFGRTKLINLRATPLDNYGNAFLKRAADIIGSLLMLILLSPLMLISVIGVKLSSPGPVFFKQERVGKDKIPFKMLKFRSMRINTEENTAWSTGTDSRRTKFGSFIRKYSIDELPQLINVLKGDMSLIGPRPEIPYYVAQFKEEVPLYLVRQQVRPGMTGWAQIHGLRGDTSIEKRVEYDIWYIENWSLTLDVKILFATVFKGKFVNDEVL